MVKFGDNRFLGTPIKNNTVLFFAMVFIFEISLLTTGCVSKQSKLDRMFKEAEQLVSESKVDQAIEKYNKILEEDPKNIMAIMKLGKLYIKEKKYDAAMASYQKALKIKPDSSGVNLNIGSMYIKKVDYDAAIVSYQKALKIRPNWADAYYGIGHAQRGKGDYDAAIASYRKTLKLKPDSAGVYYNMGIAYYYKGDYNGAIDNYRKALKLKPDWDDALFNIGFMQGKKGDYDAAIESYKKTIKLYPDYADAYYNMGLMQKGKGDYDSAIGSFKKALEIEPTDILAMTNLTDLYLITERFDKAVKLANQVLKEKGVKQYQILAMRSIIISSLFFKGNQTQAVKELKQLIMYYRGLTNELSQAWNYSNTKKFITQTQRLSEPTRALLLKMIDLLEAPIKDRDPILVELEKMVEEYK